MGEVLTQVDALRRRAAARGRGQTFVFTNGCFDLIHPGHVALLREKLKKVPPADTKRIEQLIDELSTPRFAAREKAMAELNKLGELAELALRKALEGGKLTLEARQRVERLIEWLTRLTPERLRVLRAVEALEFARDAAATKLLEELASGAPEGLLTRQARAAVGRLR